MSIGKTGSFPEAISSGLDSISRGISKANDLGGAQALKDAVQLFGPSRSNSFSNVTAQAFKGPGLVSEAHIQPPQKFYSQHPAVQKGTISTQDLKTKLEDPQLNLQKGLDGLKSSFDEAHDKMKEQLDSVSDMSEESQLKLQMNMGRLSKMMSTLSNMLKTISSSQGEISKNIR